MKGTKFTHRQNSMSTTWWWNTNAMNTITSVATMKTILHGTMGNNMIFDIVSRVSILFDYFLLFLCHLASQHFLMDSQFFCFSVFVFLPQPWWIRGQPSSSSTTRVRYERIIRCVEFSGNMKSSSRKISSSSFLLSKMKYFREKVSARVPDTRKL